MSGQRRSTCSPAEARNEDEDEDDLGAGVKMLVKEGRNSTDDEATRGSAGIHARGTNQTRIVADCGLQQKSDQNQNRPLS